VILTVKTVLDFTARTPYSFGENKAFFWRESSVLVVRKRRCSSAHPVCCAEMPFLRKARAVSATLKQGKVNPAWRLGCVQHSVLRYFSKKA
jgi:hypothetical protein